MGQVLLRACYALVIADHGGNFGLRVAMREKTPRFLASEWGRRSLSSSARLRSRRCWRPEMCKFVSFIQHQIVGIFDRAQSAIVRADL